MATPSAPGFNFDGPEPDFLTQGWDGHIAINPFTSTDENTTIAERKNVKGRDRRFND